MSSKTTAIRTATTILGTVLLTSLLVPSATATVADRTEDVRAAAPRTKLTFTVDDCEGCELQLTSALGTYAEADAGQVDIWSSRVRTVQQRLGHLQHPDQAHVGHVRRRPRAVGGLHRLPHHLAWRYNGKYVGDTVTLEEAVTKKRAAACWEGEPQPRGHRPARRGEGPRAGPEEGGRRAASPSCRRPRAGSGRCARSVDGVLGSQDVNICH